MKKSLAVSVAAGSIIGLAATLGVSAPANAAISQCTSNKVCAWKDTNYQGTFGSWTSSSSTLSGFANQISSTSNRRTTSIGWYYGSGYTGTRWLQAAGAAGHFAWLDPKNDSFESMVIYGS
ncbi:hypothetical protein CQ018_09620 [Arthrobacter sp. MYb227]|uniref:peptidase inhibitor family I36 protein n=1 Tax=Arthrobacter sp. MYb227 TaxID=1848601 RepID=UPI000CFB582C|nr:peptidase inhibitor family I36 protein [Arthrobacter sp. MYb227]PQZ93887.1 hypothetical protein CQ018_09620 [Arthrobacter sp. MYb227]